MSMHRVRTTANRPEQVTQWPAWRLAGMLAASPSRRLGATLAAAFFIAVIPAKVQLALNWFGSE